MSFKAGGIISGVILGGIVGGVAVTLKQIAQLHFRPEIELNDPPVPNVESMNSVMADVFRELIGPFYRMCPRESQKEYKKLIQDTMIQAEAILEIEKKLAAGEIPPSFKYRTRSQAYYNVLMRDLRGNLKKHFHTEVLHKLTDKCDQLGILLADHLTNIRNLTTL